jgi:hypothetical protein
VPKEKPPPPTIEEAIRLLAREYADRVRKVIDKRLEEMKEDDRSQRAVSVQVRGILP